MLPLSRRIAVSANVIFFPCTRLEIKLILSYLILSYLCGLVFIYTEYYALFYSILSPKYFVFFVFQCQEAWFGERNCVLLLFFNSFTFEKPFSNMV